MTSKLKKEKKALRHAIEALRDLAKEKCHKRSCGSVCLCSRCHAIDALKYFDPEWNP